jgi:hypothetical protein
MSSANLYNDLFKAFREHMSDEAPQSTREITLSIKALFRNYFGPRFTVLFGHEKGSEYMADVLITSFDPKHLIQSGSLDLLPEQIEVYLVVESELGGKGGSSAYGVMKNVVEDYVKLLILQAEFRVMVFTSLPYVSEKDHVRNRVEILRQLYKRTSGLTSGVLLIHLNGSQPRSTQVQASAAHHDIQGFLISPDGLTADPL